MMKAGVATILSMLKIVQRRPGMYFPRKSINDLVSFITGYRYGITFCSNRTDRGDDEEKALNEYILEQLNGRMGISGKQALESALIEATFGDEFEAYNLFYTLLDEFITINGILIKDVYPN